MTAPARRPVYASRCTPLVLGWGVHLPPTLHLPRLHPPTFTLCDSSPLFLSCSPPVASKTMDQTHVQLGRAEAVDLVAVAGRASRTRLAAAKLECFLGHYGFALTWAAALTGTNAVLFARAAIAEYFRQSDMPAWRRVWIPLARGCGALLNLNSAVVLLPAVRGLMDALRGSSVNLVLPLDHAMPLFHKVVAVVLLVAGFFHGFVQTVALATTPNAHPSAGLLLTTGWILVLTVGVMLGTAWSRCRQRYFEIFQATHAVGIAAYYAALLPHGMHLGRHVTWAWVTGPILLYAADRLVLRHTNARRVAVTLDRTHTEVVCAGTVLKLAIERPFGFRPGQYVRIRVPAMSRQWHPFTIASAPHEEQLLLYIRRHGPGQWTARLHDLVAGLDCGGGSWSKGIREGGSGGSCGFRSLSGGIDILVEGPFGAPSEHVGQFEHVVLFAGGVGATVYVSVVKAIHHFMEGQRAAAAAEAAVAAAAATAADGVPWEFKAPAAPGRAERRDGSVNAPPSPWTTPTRRGGRGPPGGSRFGGSVGDSTWPSTDGTEGRRDLDSLAAGGEASGYGRYDGRTHDLGGNYEAIGSADTAPPPRISPRTARLYLLLYSISVNLGLLWALLLRVLLLAMSYSVAVDAIDAGFRPVLLPFTSAGLVALDSVLAGVLFAAVSVSVALEVSLLGLRATFLPAAKGVPLGLLLASAAYAVTVDGLVLAGVRPPGGDGATARLVWEIAHLTNGAILAGSLCVRLGRVIGGRVALAAHRGNRAAHLRTVDFFWTAPTAADDAWVMHELDRAILRSTPVRLHRYLTRHRGIFVTRAWPTKKLVTTLGRPDIEKELRTLVAGLPSGATAGVFFCGPAAMGEAIRRAVATVTSESLVAALSPAEAPVALARLLVSPPRGAERGGRGQVVEGGYGHNVRLVFRQEVFL